MNETPKNPAAVALGKLGGRPKGSKGQPLDPAKAKAMAQARWAKHMKGHVSACRCDQCENLRNTTNHQGKTI